MSVNYFGAVATIAGLRPLLVEGADPSAVAVSSNSATAMADLSEALVEACVNNDEAGARALAGTDPVVAYAASKLALARRVRRTAVGTDWAGSRIRLNAVAPWLIDTLTTADMLEFVLSLGDVYPIPQDRPGRPEEVASLLAFLFSPDAGFFYGSAVFMDGGSDAALNADAWPACVT